MKFHVVVALFLVSLAATSSATSHKRDAPPEDPIAAPAAALADDAAPDAASAAVEEQRAAPAASSAEAPAADATANRPSLYLRKVRRGRPATYAKTRVVAPAAYKAAESGSNERVANYRFAYRVQAGGPTVVRGRYANDKEQAAAAAAAASNDDGSDSGEPSPARTIMTYDSRRAEFGQAETRTGGRADGKYFVQLPDGRLQTVEYYVDEKSGYVARVSYSGGSKADAYKKQ